MRSIMCVLILFVLAGASQAKNPQQEILQIIKDGQNGWNKGDIDLFMEGYLKSDSLRFSSGGQVTFGWNFVNTRYKKRYPDKTAMGTLTFSKIDIKLLSDSVAMAFGKWELKRNADHPWGYFTLIFKKFDIGWRIIHDHTSSSSEM